MIKGRKYRLPCLLLLLHLHVLLFALLTSRAASLSQPDDNTKSYIVYLGNRPTDESSASLLHTNMLKDAFGCEIASTKSVHYTYKRSFNGFVVDLTEEEASKMAEMNGVVSVFPNEKNHLHTTKSWNFIGLTEQANRSASESDVIIGVLDTGIWPESESFNDTGLGPAPAKWKGTCQNITCNNKIIGAQYFRSKTYFVGGDFISPRDLEGHGTHTASIAAGKAVNGASLYGFASGTARGGVPSARIAVYKVCWLDGCWDADILAAFDNAIADGVDIISISVGPKTPREYFRDSFSIGAFHAMRNGILTVSSAGNSGPGPSSITKIAPWIISVAASTIDRKFLTKVQLGNNMTFEGLSVNTFDLNNTMYPLIDGADAPNATSNATSARSCKPGSLDSNLVKGKIVLCDTVTNGSEPLRAGAVGAVMRYPALSYTLISVRLLPLPASVLDPVDGRKTFSYLNTASAPTATIFKSTEDEDPLAPYVKAFSSRGPNRITPDILKPDLAAPGVSILAAYTLASSITGFEEDKRFAPFNIVSGTSMACPHVSGTAAYVKSFYPSWSPAAIQSAIMTTASPMNSVINSDAEFAYGSGNLNPSKAINPGLVYDANEVDYIKFLCGQGYSTADLRKITGDNANCSVATNGTVWDLNYPSFSLSTSTSKAVTRSFKRTVTNVGSAVSTYRANVTNPAASLKIQVSPSVLSFTSLGQNLSFEVTIAGTLNTRMVSASLEWDDGEHNVRSPIVVFNSTVITIQGTLDTELVSAS